MASQNETSSTSKYLLKNDQNEIVRLSSQHEVLKLIWGKLFYSPVEQELEKGITVLDSGCGPGSWTLDMSNLYPQSTFHGVDISTMFSVHDNSTTKPSNCHFQVGNVLEPLPFDDNHFDFIHQRLLGVAIPQQRWQSVLDGFMCALKPGGWIELMETSDVINMSPKGALLRECLYSSAVARGIRMSATRELELYMMNSGFVNIKVVPILLPFGKNPNGDNTVSDLFKKDFLQLYRRDAIRQLAMKNLSEIETPEDYDQFLTDILKEYDQYQTSMLAFRFYGQKTMS